MKQVIMSNGDLVLSIEGEQALVRKAMAAGNDSAFVETLLRKSAVGGLYAVQPWKAGFVADTAAISDVPLDAEDDVVSPKVWAYQADKSMAEELIRQGSVRLVRIH